MKKYLAIPAALAVAGGLLVASPAAADSVSGATLTWKISDCVFSACPSLNETQSVAGEVEKGTDGWVFRSGQMSYNATTGASNVDFAGSVTVGNTNMGGYSITFRDPFVRVAAGGAGALYADLIYKESAASPEVTRDDVKVVDLPAVPNALGWSVTPPWDGVGTPGSSGGPAPVEGRQFAQPLMDALPASLKAWFWATGLTGSNLTKSPAPVAVAAKPTVTIEGADDLVVNKEATITVKGTGFDPAKKTAAVTGLYVVFGPNISALGYGMEQQKAFGAAQYLTTAPDANGAFTTTLTITGRYTDQNGKTWDGTKDTLGVSTWAAHSHAITDWDTFTPITFKAATTTKLTLQDAKIKPGKRAKAVVKVKGGTGKVEVKEGKKVLVTKKTDAKGQVTLKLPKLKVGKHTLKAVYLGSDQADRSVSKKVVLRVG